MAGIYCDATALLAGLQLAIGFSSVLLSAIDVIIFDLWLDKNATVPFA